MELRYRLAGDLPALRIPPPAPPERVDGLWQHACFEAFAAGEGASYCEFNLSPSGEWAAYRFETYRGGMVPLAAAPPAISTACAPDRLELRASISLPAGARRLGLAAVVEEADGSKTYWALAHPAGAPDFHDPACFALDLPPPTGPC